MMVSSPPLFLSHYLLTLFTEKKGGYVLIPAGRDPSDDGDGDCLALNKQKYLKFVEEIKKNKGNTALDPTSVEIVTEGHYVLFKGGCIPQNEKKKWFSILRILAGAGTKSRAYTAFRPRMQYCTIQSRVPNDGESVPYTRVSLRQYFGWFHIYYLPFSQMKFGAKFANAIWYVG